MIEERIVTETGTGIETEIVIGIKGTVIGRGGKTGRGKEIGRDDNGAAAAGTGTGTGGGEVEAGELKAKEGMGRKGRGAKEGMGSRGRGEGGLEGRRGGRKRERRLRNKRKGEEM